jgi:serine/threonine protein kinase
MLRQHGPGNDGLLSLLRKLFTLNPFQRLTAEKALKEPYFSEFDIANCAVDDWIVKL